MSAEIDALLREIDFLLVDLRETLRNINNFNPDDRRPKLLKCQKCMQAVRTAKEATMLEARSLLSAAEKSEVKESLRKRMEVFKQLVSEYDYKNNEIDRDQLQVEAESFENLEGNQKNQTQALIARGDMLQDQTQDAISRMKGLAVDAEEIGIATAAKMDHQMEQMGRVAEDLDDVKYNTLRARQTAFAMAKGAAGDLCIQILCGGIVICTIAIVILVSV